MEARDELAVTMQARIIVIGNRRLTKSRFQLHVQFDFGCSGSAQRTSLLSTLAHSVDSFWDHLFKLSKKRTLTHKDLSMRRGQIEPFGAIHFWKVLKPP